MVMGDVMNKEGQLVIEYIIVICVLLLIVVGALNILVSEFIQSTAVLKLGEEQRAKQIIIKNVELCHYVYDTFKDCDMESLYRIGD